MRKVHIIRGDASYQHLFREMGYSIVPKITDADILVFTGGADVSPMYYGHKRHDSTHFDVSRDDHESGIFQYALANDIPMVGVCRGGQLLNVLSGGEMYQDVSKHVMSHSITDLETGEVVFVSSTHHQMMKPSEKGLLVATAAQGGSREWWDGEIFKREVSTQDIEVVFYEHTKCLCFQPHPEFASPDYVGMRTYFKGLLERFIWSKK